MRSPISQSATISGMEINSHSPLTRGGIVFGLIILYSLVSYYLMPIFGLEVAVLSGFPVAVAGWYFGLAGGIIASLAVVILNNFLMTIFGGIPWYTVDRNGLTMSALILMMIGVGAGQINKYYSARLRAEIQLDSRERFLALLNNITHTIIAEKNLDAIMQILANYLCALLKADSCYFTQWDPVKEQVFPVATNMKSNHPFLKMEYPKGEKNLTTSALMAGHTLIIENTSDTPHTTPRIIQKFTEKSFISIPLIYGKNKLGAAVVGFNESHKFSAEELEHAERASNQIALAIWSTQQELKLKKHLQEVQTLARISHALSETEKTGLQTVLQLIVTSAKELISSAEQAVIHLLDEEQQLLIAEAVVGYAENVTSWKLLKIRPNDGVAGLVIVNGKTINIADISTDSRFLPTSAVPSYRSLMVAPLQSGERKLGTISVQSSLVNAFTEAESQLLTALGIQASIAIENANLLEKTKQSLKETNVLYHINQGLAAASFDPDQLMDMVVNILYNNFKYYHIHIYLIDPQSGDLISRHGIGEASQEFIKTSARLPVATGIIGHVAETHQPFITNNVDNVIFFMRHPLLPDTKSELAVPIMINGEALGVLNIEDRSNIPSHHLFMMSAIADQLAVALQKANLYEDLQTSLQHEKEFRNQLIQNERLTVMGRLLASVSHELNNPLQAIQNALFLLKAEQELSTQGKQDLEIVLSETDRMAAMIQSLRATYRPIHAEDFKPVQVNTIMEDVYALVSTHLRYNNISFEFYPDPALPVIPGLADQIRQVFLNLFMNAVEAMKANGRLSVSTKHLEAEGEIFLSISDTGTGIESLILPNILDAFITNKETGTGLGLTITYDIIIKHQGRITAENNPENGATFKIWLPTSRMELP